MSKTVVVIDDSVFLRKQIVQFFEEKLGLKVIATGADGNDAVALYNHHKPDLITLDITMPNKDGQQALLEILKEYPGANVLMISAVRGEAMLQCLNSGAKGYIEKPLKFGNSDFVEEFKTVVKEIFR